MSQFIVSALFNRAVAGLRAVGHERGQGIRMRDDAAPV